MRQCLWRFIQIIFHKSGWISDLTILAMTTVTLTIQALTIGALTILSRLLNWYFHGLKGLLRLDVGGSWDDSACWHDKGLSNLEHGGRDDVGCLFDWDQSSLLTNLDRDHLWFLSQVAFLLDSLNHLHGLGWHHLWKAVLLHPEKTLPDPLVHLVLHARQLALLLRNPELATRVCLLKSAGDLLVYNFILTEFLDELLIRYVE